MQGRDRTRWSGAISCMEAKAMSQSVKYVGLDVHKDTIAVAVAEDGKRSEVREHGEIANTPAALTKRRPSQ